MTAVINVHSPGTLTYDKFICIQFWKPESNISIIRTKPSCWQVQVPVDVLKKPPFAYFVHVGIVNSNSLIDLEMMIS